MEIYNFKEIEKKWRKYWLENKTFKTTEDDSKPYFFALDMFPYPSGAGLHVGHAAGYTATDIIARYKKMKGFNVLHAIGWDAFGLPAEQYAIKTGKHPSKFTNKNIDTFREQLQLLGFSFDWDKEINTSDPKYYKWTQWIFTQFVEHDLAELREVSVNWCEELSTVLANDEIETDEKGNQVSERTGYPIVQKPMKQWVIKSTAFADNLVEGLDQLDWVESTKKMQKNFIKNPSTGELNLRDWTFSRQRYWGEPFPVKHNSDGTIDLLKEYELPLILPDLNDFKGKDGQPALANSVEWIEKGYDLNTMPGSAASSWYHLAYILKNESGYLPLNSKQAKEKLNKWMPVDLYVGGSEHTTGHLLYARIWNNFLSQIGVLDVKEPYQHLIHQGMILGTDGKKMSKSKGNVINPNDVIEKYGADTLRAYILFMGAFEDAKPWSEEGLKSMHKWINKIWDIMHKTQTTEKVSDELNKTYAKTIKNFTKNIELYKFNVAISDLMVFINKIAKELVMTQEIKLNFIKLLNVICPHIAQELWAKQEQTSELANADWPETVESLLADKSFEMPIMQNGKLRGTIKIPKGLNQEEVVLIVLQNEKFASMIKESKKVVYVQDKILNIVG